MSGEKTSKVGPVDHVEHGDQSQKIRKNISDFSVPWLLGLTAGLLSSAPPRGLIKLLP